MAFCIFTSLKLPHGGHDPSMTPAEAVHCITPSLSTDVHFTPGAVDILASLEESVQFDVSDPYTGYTSEQRKGRVPGSMC